jgi:CHASE3 domain sensor protein
MRYLAVALIIWGAIACGGRRELSEQAYAEQVQEYTATLADAIAEIRRLLTDAEQRVALILNDAWRADIQAQFAIVHGAADDVANMRPPERFAEAHRALERATECYADATDLLRDALATPPVASAMVVSMLLSCNDLMQDALVAMQRVR